MRMIYRNKENTDYWDDRWERAGVDSRGFNNLDIYPIKYSELVCKDAIDILEAGCGAGRLYFHYKKYGKNIKGIEYSQLAVNNILKEDPKADVIQGDVADMPYQDNSFDVILAFGLLHNFKEDTSLSKAFKETIRVLRPKGKLIASVRFDSLENRIIEKIIRLKNKKDLFNKFHRRHFSKADIEYYLNNKMELKQIFYARNVSFLFKFNIFRSKKMKLKNFNEKEARSKGFQLNLVGRIMDKILHDLFPKHFSNLLVFIAEKC